MLGNDMKRLLKQRRLWLLLPLTAIFLFLSYNDVNIEGPFYPQDVPTVLGAGSLWSPFHAKQGALFYGITVFLAAGLIGADMFLIDQKSGLDQQLTLRKSRTHYTLSHYASIFVVTGILCILPIIGNILMTFMRFPFIPTTELAQIPGTSTRIAWPTLFYEHWFLFMALYLLRTFCLTGLIGCFATAISNFSKNRYLGLFLPYAFVFLFGLVSLIGIPAHMALSSVITTGPFSLADYMCIFVILAICFLDIARQCNRKNYL